ncbi:tRNA U34 5-methylaminomethyl-2-thiouridine-forming methyltransferase MnmC [Flavobacteriaceae bacterium MAR_2010_188]|nr:tRNA U34 5-methylaminomethyl-2-thiouridine-forming methyltransferase MnmC [Flavobacteriaceae bacterium MAR_2010_188]
MKREIITTADGSKTIKILDWDEQYHSVHGAINEANHVFIKHGLQYFKDSQKTEKPIRILEIGFGTGLNALLTLNYSITNSLGIEYCGIEAYPVQNSEIEELNYPVLVGADPNIFSEMHQIEWEKPSFLSPTFSLTKKKMFFQDIEFIDEFDLIYFDAFGARVQPDLWEQIIFDKMFTALSLNGVLVTYCAKGSVRRAMISSGFKVERLPGPPGKREMLRASKIV